MPNEHLKWHLKVQYMERMTGIKPSIHLEWLCNANEIDFDIAYIKMLRQQFKERFPIDGAVTYVPFNTEYALYKQMGFRPSFMERIKEITQS